VGAKDRVSMADPGNKETWGIVVFSIAVIAPSPVVETPPPNPSLEKKKLDCQQSVLCSKI